LEDEDGSDVKKCEDNFAVLIDHDSISEISAVKDFILHYLLEIKYLI
jgi:hypothetical protein